MARWVVKYFFNSQRGITGFHFPVFVASQSLSLGSLTQWIRKALRHRVGQIRSHLVEIINYGKLNMLAF